MHVLAYPHKRDRRGSLRHLRRRRVSSYFGMLTQKTLALIADQRTPILSIPAAELSNEVAI